MTVDPVAVEAALTAWALACCSAQAATAGHASLPRNERRPVLAVDPLQRMRRRAGAQATAAGPIGLRGLEVNR